MSCGEDISHIVPISDGYALPTTRSCFDLAGRDLTGIYLLLLLLLLLLLFLFRLPHPDANQGTRVRLEPYRCLPDREGHQREVLICRTRLPTRDEKHPLLSSQEDRLLPPPLSPPRKTLPLVSLQGRCGCPLLRLTRQMLQAP